MYAEGEGFAPPQAQYGYAAVLGVIMRPLLLTMGFIFAFFIMDIGGWFVGQALEVFLAGMGAANIGAVGFVAMLAVIITTMFLFMKTVLKLITHLADRVPQWIGGHSGQGLGESELSQSAVQSAGGKGKEMALYGGNMASNAIDAVGAGVMASMESSKKKGKDDKKDDEKTKQLDGGAAAETESKEKGKDGPEPSQVK